jgi:hypothetical protein
MLKENDIEIVQYLRPLHPVTTCLEHVQDFYFQVAQTFESNNARKKGLILPFKSLVFKKQQNMVDKPYFLLLQDVNVYVDGDYAISNYPKLIHSHY